MRRVDNNNLHDVGRQRPLARTHRQTAGAHRTCRLRPIRNSSDRYATRLTWLASKCALVSFHASIRRSRTLHTYNRGRSGTACVSCYRTENSSMATWDELLGDVALLLSTTAPGAHSPVRSGQIGLLVVKVKPRGGQSVLHVVHDGALDGVNVCRSRRGDARGSFTQWDDRSAGGRRCHAIQRRAHTTGPLKRCLSKPASASAHVVHAPADMYVFMSCKQTQSKQEHRKWGEIVDFHCKATASIPRAPCVYVVHPVCNRTKPLSCSTCHN